MIKIGIVGYGNLGRGVECAIRQNPDMELCAVFTRRSPESLKILTPDVPVVSLNDILSWKERLDVLILCGGSATDLPAMPKFPTISPWWTRRRRKAATLPSSPWAGIRACSV